VDSNQILASLCSWYHRNESNHTVKRNTMGPILYNIIMTWRLLLNIIYKLFTSE